MAKRKMTAKQFWEILERCHFSREIWGYEGILNIISCNERKDAQECFSTGFNDAGKGCQQRSDMIYNELKALGYYGTCD